MSRKDTKTTFIENILFFQAWKSRINRISHSRWFDQDIADIR